MISMTICYFFVFSLLLMVEVFVVNVSYLLYGFITLIRLFHYNIIYDITSRLISSLISIDLSSCMLSWLLKTKQDMIPILTSMFLISSLRLSIELFIFIKGCSLVTLSVFSCKTYCIFSCFYIM